MTYSDFTQSAVLKKFALVLDEQSDLFAGVAEREPSAWLTETLDVTAPLAFAVQSEKARSELVIAPLLTEIYRARGGAVKLFSGNQFNVDASEGLAGYFDFLLTRSPSNTVIEAPVLCIVEAKKENVPGGYGQCMATMVAAARFNRENNEPIPTVYGAVTTGDIWKFLTLTGTDVRVDRETYYLDRLPRLLGVLYHVTQ